LFASTLLKAGRIESFLTSARTFHERPFRGDLKTSVVRVERAIGYPLSRYLRLCSTSVRQLEPQP
jgi:hypothetical protein